MIKLIVSDLDGTLLNVAHTLDKRSADAIKAAQKAGIEFMIATGRGFGSVKPMLDEFDIQCPCVLLNGAVYQSKDEVVQKTIAIDNERIKQIVEILVTYDINVHFYTKEGTSAENPERLRADFIERIKSQDHLSDEEIEEILETSNFCNFDIRIEDYASYFVSNPVIYKLEAFSNDDEKMRKVRLALANISNIEITNSIGNNFELTDHRAQKGVVLEILCEELGYAKEEVIVMGDSMNDFSMMKLFPNSFAMENGCATIQEAAKYRIGKNSEFAVAKKIEEVVGLATSNSN